MKTEMPLWYNRYYLAKSATGMSEGAPRQTENVESLDEWRKLCDAAPEAVGVLLDEADYEHLGRAEQMEVLKKLIVVHGAMHEGTREPINNDNRFIVELLAGKLHHAETEGRKAEAIAA